MKNLRSSLLGSLLPLGALLALGALGACEDTVVIGGNNKPCANDAQCPQGQFCTPNGVCSGGACQPVSEVCDGKDNDCDGVTDDGAICLNGTECIKGACANPCVPSPEVCDGIDNDCNGMVDDDDGMSICQCQADADCPPNQLCTNNVCQ